MRTDTDTNVVERVSRFRIRCHTPRGGGQCTHPRVLHEHEIGIVATRKERNCAITQRERNIEWVECVHSNIEWVECVHSNIEWVECAHSNMSFRTTREHSMIIMKGST